MGINEKLSVKTWTPVVNFVRFRYFASKKPYFRRYGYKDNVSQRGLLPRHKNFDRITQMPIYKPREFWTEDKARKGQNDYIDILGDENIHPVHISYEVPKWLRGFRGNEFQMLLRKKEHFSEEMALNKPIKYREMIRRLFELKKFLDRKTIDFYWEKDYGKN